MTTFASNWPLIIVFFALLVAAITFLVYDSINLIASIRGKEKSQKNPAKFIQIRIGVNIITITGIILIIFTMYAEGTRSPIQNTNPLEAGEMY